MLIKYVGGARNIFSNSIDLFCFLLPGGGGGDGDRGFSFDNSTNNRWSPCVGLNHLSIVYLSIRINIF